MTKHIFILGGNLIGLYSAVRCVELGYNVSIIDKKSSFNIKSSNYKLFNKNHSLYIQLLNKFSINYAQHSALGNEKLFNILSYVILKSKLIPKKTLVNQSFAAFCKTLLPSYEYDVLKTYIEDFEYIFLNMSAMDAIHMFGNDLTANQEYYILTENIQTLLDKIVEYLRDNNVNFIFNTEIKDIKHGHHNIQLISANDVYISHILIITLSKRNIPFKIFNKEQKSILNNVSNYNINIDNIYSIIYSNKSESEQSTKNQLLDRLHIVYPMNKNISKMYLWNIGINNIIIREKIKQIFPIFVCSESYSKNPFFINYSLETFDNVLPKIVRLCSIGTTKTA